MAFSFKSTRSPRFPPPEQADEHGIVLVGGSLTPQWILAAYRQGIFPWPHEFPEGVYLLWFSPDPRAVLELDRFHVSRRLRDRIRSARMTVTFDRDFAGVIQACALPRKHERGTWLIPEMIAAYQTLHEQGHTHSVEVWRDGQLVGGVYGLAMGGFFAAESMFHRETDASKIALYFLVQRLRERGFTLLDIQQTTPHLQRLGSSELPRAQFLTRLQQALAAPALPFAGDLPQDTITK